MSIQQAIEVISFGVCGTLLDWDQGLQAELTGAAGLDAGLAARIVADRVDAEWEMLDEMPDFLPYRAVFAASLERAAAGAGASLDPETAQRIAASIAGWPLFPDVASALPRLAAGRRIALASNLDREDLAQVARRLGAPVAHSAAAADIGEYKPAPELLLALLHELEIDEQQLLHVSASVERDLYTAEDLEVAAVFLDRSGAGAPEDLTVSLTVRNLDELAGQLRPARARPSSGRRDGGGARGKTAPSKKRRPAPGSRPPRRA